MLGTISRLRRSTTRSKRPAAATKSTSRREKPRPLSYGDPDSGAGLLKPSAAGSSRRARSHETDRRRRSAVVSSSDDDYYYQSHHSSARPPRESRPRRESVSPPRRRQSVSPRPPRHRQSPSPRPTRRTTSLRDPRDQRRRPRRDASISADDLESRPRSPRPSSGSPRYPSDRLPRRPAHPTDSAHSSRRPSFVKPYSAEPRRPDDRRRMSYESRPPVTGASKSSSPAGAKPSTHAQPEPLRGRPRSRSREDVRKPREHDTASVTKPGDKPAQKPKPKPKPKPTSPSESSKPAGESSRKPSTGGVDFLEKLPQALATFGGLKALTDHADTAKEWADWLNDLHGAPEEIQALSAKATTAKDTITQIQHSLQARPDLVEGESGQILKQQIEAAVKSADKALAEMTELLQDLGNDGSEGTVWKGLQDFYNSYRYKNEWEAKIKEAEVNLQKELGTLSTLMVNIYSRALMKPAPPGLGATIPPPAPLKVANIPGPEPPAAKDEKPAAAASSSLPSLLGEVKNTYTPPAPEFSSSNTPPEQLQTPPMSAKRRASRPPSPSVLAYEEANIGTDLALYDPPLSPASPDEPADSPPDEPSEPAKNKTPAEPDRTADSGDTQTTDKKDKAASRATPPRQEQEAALLDAAWNGDLEATKQALLHLSPMTRDLQGLTPLHLAVERDHLAIAMLLLDNHADCSARATGGRTPLHLAARFASAATVEFLLDDGHADANARTSDGRTPLHYAATAADDGDEERREVMRVLRDWGADPTLQDNKGRTPRDLAQKRDHWDASSTLRRAEKRWEERHHQSWLQRHGFKK
ncbi:hypothetical protein QQX98_003169 [Neonectria punicea]|uniref:Uncharacterized protein n=1 Tax=Neonectria punicea TaxID=979145 RepID=A0ABR1HF74_9HYPO